MARLLLTMLVTAIIGSAYAGGSFSVMVVPLAGYIDFNLEQDITTVDGWTISAGSGFAASFTNGIEKLQPYVIGCQSFDAWITAAQWCVETRALLVGDGDWIRGFLSIVW